MRINNFRGEVLQETMPQKLDLIDQKIIYLLSKNCRTSNTALGKFLKIKREVVAYRINQLIKKKLITGFFTILDSRKLGFMTFSVYVKLKSTIEEDKIIEELMTDSQVSLVSTCSGRYDLFLKVTTRTLEEFEYILNKFLKKYFLIIREYDILNFLREDPTGNNIILGEKSDEITKNLNLVEVKGSTFNKEFKMLEDETNKSSKPSLKVFQVDELDRKILSFLKFNARATLKEVASQVNITPNAAKSRISHLISAGIIKGFIPLISFSSLGYQWFMVMLNLSEVKESRLYSYMQQHPNIEWCVKCVGLWNYKISVFAKDNYEFNRVLNEIRNEFKEEINSFDSIILFNQYKFNHRVE